MTETAHYPDWTTFGPKMRALGERERRFVWSYLMGALHDGKQNGAAAAREAGYSNVKDGAKVRAHELLHREGVLDAVQEVSGRELRGLAIPAVVALSRLLAKPDHADHRKSIEMVLNRIGHSERTAVDVNVTGEVTVNHTEAALADLRAMLELQVPRSKLEEIFGFSGLARYERMLAEADGRKVKVIEHDPSVA